MTGLPDRPTILFAHAVYALATTASARSLPAEILEARTLEQTEALLPQADVLVISGLWRNTLLPLMGRVKLVQSISAGVDQYPQDELRTRGIRLASNQGGNANAVSEHAISLILALMRHLHTARDNQTKRNWVGMNPDPATREQELGGKTLLVAGYGAIGSRLARLAQAFGMKVIATRRTVRKADDNGIAVVTQDRFREFLPQADVVALTCPLTDQTRGMVDAAAFAAMKPSALLVNCARGRVVDEAALIAALRDKRIAGAGLDVFYDEPLPAESPLWGFETALITPHTGGETNLYESNVLDTLAENLKRLRQGEALRNQIV